MCLANGAKPDHNKNNTSQDDMRVKIQESNNNTTAITNSKGNNHTVVGAGTRRCQRSICSEICVEWYPCGSGQEWFPSTTEEDGGTMTSPTSTSSTLLLLLVWKFLTCMGSMFTMGYGFYRLHTAFYMAYFSHWGIVFATLYFLCSLLDSVLDWCCSSKSTNQPEPSINNDDDDVTDLEEATLSTATHLNESDAMTVVTTVTKAEAGANTTTTTLMGVSTIVHRVTILLFAVAVNIGTLSSIVYWLFGCIIGFRWGPSLYLDLAPHLIIPLLVVIDGFLIHQRPLRGVYFLGFVLPIELLYPLWTLIHDVATNIGNPEYSDSLDDTNDDGIYPFSWKEDPNQAMLLNACALVGFFVTYFILWWIAKRLQQRQRQ